MLITNIRDDVMNKRFIEYQHNNAILEGYLAYDPDIKGRRPAVLIAHAWGGRDEFVMEKANRLAELGYVGFALDMYGKAILGADTETNSKLMSPFMADRQLLQDRMLKALNTVKNVELVDRDRIGAMGFCFGGLCALDLARSGADLKAVVSFHGLLQQPENTTPKPIPARILALHGYDDPMVTPEDLLAFADEMNQYCPDWQLHAYGHAKHAFTNPQANDEALGTVFNANACKRSWQAMQNFFQESFA